MILRKNNNKSYIVFLTFVAISLIGILVLSIFTAKEQKNKTSNYNKVVNLNSYSVKIFDAQYNPTTKEISFSMGVKTNYSTASEPKITEIFIPYSNEYTFSSEITDEYIQRVTIPNVNANFEYLRLTISSKKPDIQPEPKEDEFGAIVTQPITKGDTNKIYVYIDYRDFEITNDNKKANIPFSPALSTTTPTTVTTAPPQTSSVITTTVVTTKPEPATVSTTTKKPTSESSSATSKITTSTAKKTTTTTTTKATTTTKVTTTKAPETTTKKATTTTQKVTTAETTTTVYIRLTGLEIQQKGQEDLLLGESVTLTPIFHPNRATNKKVTWISNRTDRVIVDENGKCTAVGEGAAIITCVSDDGGLRASYMIVGVDG